MRDGIIKTIVVIVSSVTFLSCGHNDSSDYFLSKAQMLNHEVHGDSVNWLTIEKLLARHTENDLAERIAGIKNDRYRQMAKQSLDMFVAMPEPDSKILWLSEILSLIELDEVKNTLESGAYVPKISAESWNVGLNDTFRAEIYFAAPISNRDQISIYKEGSEEPIEILRRNSTSSFIFETSLNKVGENKFLAKGLKYVNGVQEEFEVMFYPTARPEP